MNYVVIGVLLYVYAPLLIEGIVWLTMDPSERQRAILEAKEARRIAVRGGL